MYVNGNFTPPMFLKIASMHPVARVVHILPSAASAPHATLPMVLNGQRLPCCRNPGKHVAGRWGIALLLDLPVLLGH